MMKFVLFYTSLEGKKVKEILPLLEKVKSIFDLKVENKEIKEFGEEELKRTIFWPLSVSKRIKIHQTRRGKSLYTQLVIFLDNKPFTFYPQKRGKDKITIKEFLEKLLEGKVVCLHDAKELEECLRKKNES